GRPTARQPWPAPAPGAPWPPSPPSSTESPEPCGPRTESHVSSSASRSHTAGSPPSSSPRTPSGSATSTSRSSTTEEPGEPRLAGAQRGANPQDCSSAYGQCGKG